LERTYRLLGDLGNPQNRLPPCFHVAGTNGKGSIVAFLRSSIECAGMSCHVMTSPHLVRLNERFVLRGREIETTALIDLLEYVESVNAGQPTTSFEILTSAGFLAFAQTPADVALIEVGMGGRYDATNVLPSALASVISVISYDHVKFLGHDLCQIAGEKAGIVKKQTPCIVGPQTKEGLKAGVMDVFAEEAARQNAPLFRYGYEWSFDDLPESFLLHTGFSSFELPKPNLLGAHQVRNAATAAMTLLTIQDRLPKPLSESSLCQGLVSAKWPARLQLLTHGPLADMLPNGWELWLDGGHNDTGGQVLSEQADFWARKDGKPLYLVLGMLSTKDPRDFVAPLACKIMGIHTVSIPKQILSLSGEDLAVIAREFLPSVFSAETIAEAISDILLRCPDSSGRILIAGSLYLAGTILKENT
jgi:dihydrofolate synthase/folylpolyglutamate synthase